MPQVAMPQTVVGSKRLELKKPHHATSHGREQKAGIEKSHLVDPTNLVGSSSGSRDSLRKLLPFAYALTVVRKLPLTVVRKLP